MRILSVALLLGALSLPLFASEKEKKDDVQVRIYGFVRNDLILDSRETVSGLDGNFIFYPKGPELDANGDDINSNYNMRLLNLTTRLGMNIKGPDILNAATSAKIEADFTAGNGVNSVALRLAYVQLRWEKDMLRVGRDWHMFSNPKNFPSIISFNSGAPFQAFGRSSQISYTRFMNKKWNSTLAIGFQESPFASDGPNGKTGDYQKDAILPNVNARIAFQDEDFKAGFVYDMKALQPLDATTSPVSGDVFKTSEILLSHSYQVYAAYNTNNWIFKGEASWTQNMSDLQMIGGYAVKSIDPTNGHREYTASNHFNTWLSAAYTKDKWTYSLFGGYIKNMGFTHNIEGDIYGRGSDIDKLWRITPSLQWKQKQLSLAFEPEITFADFGTIDKMDQGEVINTDGVTNYRYQISMRYTF